MKKILCIIMIGVLMLIPAVPKTEAATCNHEWVEVFKPDAKITGDMFNKDMQHQSGENLSPSFIPSKNGIIWASSNHPIGYENFFSYYGVFYLSKEEVKKNSILDDIMAQRQAFSMSRTGRLRGLDQLAIKAGIDKSVVEKNSRYGSFIYVRKGTPITGNDSIFCSDTGKKRCRKCGAMK